MELKFSSSLESIHEVERFVEEISNQYHLNDNYFGNIMVALTEACRNAIIHGNAEDPAKNVHILMESKPEGLTFSVIDQGAGFNYKPYSSLDSLLLSDDIKGRGILLILSVADEVKFSNKGRVIKMLFRIAGVENEVMDERNRLMKEYFKETKKVKSDRR